MTLRPPPPDLRAVVVIPARNEAALVGGCMRALREQRGLERVVWEVILILDDCRDETIANARRAWGAAEPELHEVAVSLRGAGHARAHGMDIACARLLEVGSDDGLIATTDADSRVDPDWLAVQLQAIADGARVIGGNIVPDPLGSRPSLAALSRRERDHARRLPALAADGPAEHPFFGGASIGLTAAAYRDVGGMEPVTALEDEGFARRVRANAIPIHRLERVRVRTSMRTEGRARRGLARDLKLNEWSDRRTWRAEEFSADGLLAIKDRPVSLVLPAKEVAGTIGGIITALAPLSSNGLIDEILVVDADSGDGTGQVARAAGARVVSESSLLSRFGPCLGKGDAMWRAVAECTGEIVLFCDTDTTDFKTSFVLGLLGPMLSEPGVRLVKGAFDRPLLAGDRRLEGEGGRVTELLARPLLNLHFPDLAGFEQPLAGEIAIDRDLFAGLSVPAGYGVEIAMLIDAARIAGVGALGQTRLGTRQNRHQPLRALGTMAYEVMVAAHRRIPGGVTPVPGPLVHPSDESRAAPVCEERPPLAEIEGESLWVGTGAGGLSA